MVLCTLQQAEQPEIQLPGGGIDPDENPIPALHREVMEETGWTISAPRRLGAFRRFTFMPEYDLWAEKLCSVYLAHPTRRRGEPSEPGHTAVWLSPEAAVGMLYNDGDAEFLARLLR
jgi:8-oxo-dGTP diphosphatase